jgi:hypothetical protein
MTLAPLARRSFAEKLTANGAQPLISPLPTAYRKGKATASQPVNGAQSQTAPHFCGAVRTVIADPDYWLSLLNSARPVATMSYHSPDSRISVMPRFSMAM